jgi:hypothetical protein
MVCGHDHFYSSIRLHLKNPVWSWPAGYQVEETQAYYKKITLMK